VYNKNFIIYTFFILLKTFLSVDRCIHLIFLLMLYPHIIIYGYSLHEVGKYDLPASIDYILSISNTSQLHYIGYSMGSCVFFIMGSERPEYQPKIRSQISLAPVAFLSNTRSSLRFIAPYARVMNVSIHIYV